MKVKAPGGQPHIGWIDYAKTFAIYSVVLLHTHCVEELSVAINGYVMPLFFFLSGFLFSRERNPAFRPFLKKRFRQLVIPYLWINILAYLIWLLVLRRFGSNPGDNLSWHEPLWGILLGIPPYLAHDIPIWSVLCFFVVETVYYLLPGQGDRSDIVTASGSWLIASVICIIGGNEGIALPLTLVPATGGLAFYALGHMVRRHKEMLRSLFAFTPLTLFSWGLSGLAVLWCALYLNTPTAFFLGIWGNPLLFLVGAFGGIALGIQIAGLLEKAFHDRVLIRLVSRGTLLICGFHLLIFALIKGVALFGLGISPDSLTDGLLPGLLFSMSTMLLCIPLIMIIERRFRFLVSK